MLYLIQTFACACRALIQPSMVHPGLVVPNVRWVAFAAAALLGGTASMAATKTWNNAAGGSWHTATNWMPSGVPGVTDDVILPAGAGTVSVTTADVTVRSLSVARTLSLGRQLTVTTATVGAAITFAAGAGLTGGTYSLSAGGTFGFPAACNSFAILSNLTINGNLDIERAGIQWSNVTLNGSLNIAGSGTTAIGFDGDNTIDFPVSIASTAIVHLGQFSAGTLTIAASRTISGGTLGFNTTCFNAPMTLVNNGTIDATVGSVRFDCTINPLRGSFIGNNFSYASAVDLGGGTWNLAGRTVNLLAGGRIQNGTLSTAGSGRLAGPATGNCDSSRLSNLTINGDLNLAGGVIRWENVTLNGSLNIASVFDSRIEFFGNSIIDFPINAVGPGSTYFTHVTPGSLTIAAGNTVFGRNIYFANYCGGSTTAVINNGTIIADSSTYIGIYFSYPLTNNGTITTNSSSVYIGGSLINTGTVNSTGGTVTISGATNPLVGFFLGNNLSFQGTVDLNGGFWDLTGRTIKLNSGSTLQNGTIVNGGGGMLTGGGSCTATVLRNLTINGDLNVADGAFRWSNVRLNGGLNISGTTTTAIGFEGNRTINFPITISNTVEAEFGQATPGTLTIPSSSIISGGTVRFNRYCFDAAMTLVNNGTIIANTAGRTVSFANNVTLINNGRIEATTGSVRFEGTVNPVQGIYDGNNYSYSGTVDLGNGTWNISGRNVNLQGLSTLRNGIISATGGMLTLPLDYCAYARLSNLTINGDLNVVGGGMRWSNVTLNGALNISAVSAGHLSFNGDTTINFPVTVSGAGQIAINQENAGTLTIAAGITVSGGNIKFGGICSNQMNATALINHGSIIAGVINQNIFIACPLVNNGTITANPGSVSISGGLVNNGTIDSTAGPVTISGTFNPLVGIFAGNNLRFEGLIDLANGTWDISGRNTTLGGDTSVQNGTIVNTGGGTITLPTGCGLVRFSNLSVNGDLNVSGGGIRWNNVTLNGALNISGIYLVYIGFEGNTTINFPISIAGNTNVVLGQATAGTLTIPASRTISGGNVWFNGFCLNAPMTLVNNGTIVASTTSRQFTLANSVTLINNGTIDATVGSVTINGAINPLTGIYSGNNFSYGGNVNLGGGTWNLAGGVVTLLSSSTVQNGTILTAGGGLRFPTNVGCGLARLMNLTLNGDLNVAGGGIRWSNVTLNGAMNIFGSAPTWIGFDGNNTVTFPVTVTSGATVEFGQTTAGTLTIPASRTIAGPILAFNSGCFNAPMTLINNGTITANASGLSVVVGNSVALTNNGTINATAGSVIINGSITNYTAVGNALSGGTWRVSGGARFRIANPTGISVRHITAGTLVAIDGASSAFVNSNFTNVLASLATVAGHLQLSNSAQSVVPFNGVLTNSGTLSLDRAPLTVTGAYVQTGAGTLALGVGGASLQAYGRLAVSGSATLAGAFAAQPAGGFVPNAGDEYNAVTAMAVAGVFGQRIGGGGYYPADSYTAALAKFSFLACPSILSPLRDATACPLGAVTFAASVSGAMPFAYSWERNTPGGWVPVIDGVLPGICTISGSSSDVLVVTVPQVAGLQFRYVVSNLCGVAISGAGSVVFPVRCSRADLAGTSADGASCSDGVVDGSDFIAFINSFSVGDPVIDPMADVAGAGPSNELPDGIIDSNDFVVFINAFAAGC